MRIYKKVLFLATLALFVNCKSNHKDNALAVTKKPNIIFLLTDDQRFDALGAMGNTIIKTPNLDRLAENGVLFKNGYVTTSICCVSRASIFTGQYESRHKINDFVTSFSPEQLQQTYPMLLKKEGYAVGFIGKYGVGNPKDQPKKEFDFWRGVNRHQPKYENITKQGDTIHYTDMVENFMVEFLKQTNKKQPFCLSVSFKAPHAEDADARQFIAKPDLQKYYENITIPVPETAASNYLDSLPDFLKSDKNIGRVRWKQRFSNPEQYQKMVKNYYRLITGVDEAVGVLLQELKKQNLADNTVIVFMGDNGMYLGEHGLAGKWFGHEESVRVPMFIFDPRTKPAKNKVDEIALNIDIAPTILGLAGVSTTKEMQGVNLLDANAVKSANRNSFFYEHTFLGSPKLPKVEGIVSPKLKYLNYIEYNHEEFYDLQKDPKEKQNLIHHPEYQAVIDSLRVVYKHKKEAIK